MGSVMACPLMCPAFLLQWRLTGLIVGAILVIALFCYFS
jgi:hypothetical protein